MSIPALENVALWHERDISHSSVERVIGPDATIDARFRAGPADGVIDKLVVYPERDGAQSRQAAAGWSFSQRVLLALTQAGHEPRGRLPRRAAQRDAGLARQGRFRTTLLKDDKDVAALLPPAQIDAAFDDAYHIKYVDTIFKRVFGES